MEKHNFVSVSFKTTFLVITARKMHLFLENLENLEICKKKWKLSDNLQNKNRFGSIWVIFQEVMTKNVVLKPIANKSVSVFPMGF